MICSAPKIMTFSSKPDYLNLRVVPYFTNPPKSSIKMLVPCRKCMACTFLLSQQWQFRCSQELPLHEYSCSLTLTYKDNRKLHNYKDLQDFYKRIRSIIQYNSKRKKDKHKYPGINLPPTGKIKYINAQEYGKNGNNRHFHTAIMGISFNDLVSKTVLNTNAKPGDYNRYKTIQYSPTLEKLWPHGFNTVQPVTEETINYIVGYTYKGGKTPPLPLKTYKRRSSEAYLFEYEHDKYKHIIKNKRLLKRFSRLQNRIEHIQKVQLPYYKKDKLANSFSIARLNAKLSALYDHARNLQNIITKHESRRPELELHYIYMEKPDPYYGNKKRQSQSIGFNFLTSIENIYRYMYEGVNTTKYHINKIEGYEYYIKRYTPLEQELKALRFITLVETLNEIPPLPIQQSRQRISSAKFTSRQEAYLKRRTL